MVAVRRGAKLSLTAGLVVHRLGDVVEMQRWGLSLEGVRTLGANVALFQVTLSFEIGDLGDMSGRHGSDEMSCGFDRGVQKP